MKKSVLTFLVVGPLLLSAIANNNNHRGFPKDHTLKAVLEKPFKRVPLYGFNDNKISGSSWNDNAFTDSVASMRFKVLRYPGGVIGDYWDWKKGWFIDNPNPTSPDRPEMSSVLADNLARFKRNRYLPMGLKEIKGVLTKTGSQVVFNLNMITKTLDDQIDMLKYAQSEGIAVKWIEMGNEYNNKEDLGRKKFANLNEYTSACRTWIKALKEKFPGAKIAIIGGNKPYSSDVQHWNKDILREVPDADAINGHFYPFWNKVVDDNGINFESLDNAYREDFEKKGFNGLDKKMWITEYNIQWIYPQTKDDHQKYAYTWGQALSTILMTSLSTSLPSKDPEMILDHNIAGWRGFAAVDINNNKVELLPNGIGFREWCRASDNKTSMTQITFKQSNGSNSKDFEVLGWQFKGNNGKTNLIVNFTSDPVKIDVSAIGGNGNKYYVLNYADKNKIINNWNDYEHARKEVTNNTIELPPYSIARW